MALLYLPQGSTKRTIVWLCLMVLLCGSHTAAQIDVLQRSFLDPPDDARIMMRWWWFGPAVENAQLEREMRLMKEGGIGGFEVQPVYPLSLDDAEKGIKTFPFLSPEFLNSLRFTADKAKELGLRFDLTLGSGWPFGGPSVSIEHAAARLRYERVKIEPNSKYVKVPPIGAGEKLIAVFLVHGDGKSFAADSVKELTSTRDGVVKLSENAEDGNEVLFYISSRTGMQVKRPAVGGEGFVLDHLNRAATDAYLKNVGDRLMSAFGANKPYAIFCDSLEVYNADWSSDFLEEFQRRRGYDLKPLLPFLVNDFGYRTKALRRDWGKTLTELLNERFLAPMQEWSKRHGVLFRIQDYGVPSAALSSNAFADISEGEGAQWKVVRAARWASSANHIYNRNITSSETWTWLHSPSFRATPLDIKVEADIHFLQGINQLIGHGWPYTPPQVDYPGWRFYAAGVFNDKNPWWIVMRDVSRYLQRVSFMMRAGQPANDVAVYLPNDDAWAEMSPGNPHLIEVLREHLGPDLLPAIFAAGYNIDFFDDDSFRQVGRIDNGALVLGKNKYKVIVLPNVETIPVDTYRKFEEFARAKGVLIATKRTPSKAPGFRATFEDHQQIADITKGLFESTASTAQLVENESKDLGQTLNRLAQPDVEFVRGPSDVAFIHRRTEDAEIYFIVNTLNIPQRVEAKFRVSQLRPEWWNPFDGSVRTAVKEWGGFETQAVKLDLEPYGSRLLVFSKRMLTSSETETLVETTPMDLSTGWKVSIGTAAPVQWDKLRSWTDDETTRYYSGVATYEKDVTIPATLLQQSRSLRLDFGAGIPLAPQPLRNGMQAWLESPVREAAVVFINDTLAGSVWCPPYSVEVKKFLRPGQNRIRIVVGNTAMNYMARRALPDYRLLNLRYGERFQPQDMDKIQPLPSGILGPVRLIGKKPFSRG
ncbi:MAG TPA: glycosyl hydrolase [Pyrinomonadaceae bacterium]|nr:glycosyl hydrolase [Pyrinomonadaceae bacterium]